MIIVAFYSEQWVKIQVNEKGEKEWDAWKRCKKADEY